MLTKNLLIGTLIAVVVVFTSKTIWGSQITHLINKGFSFPITSTIRHLQPNISWEKANKHAWEVYKQAERTGVNWKLIVAVTMQESSFMFFKGDKTCGLNAYGYEKCVHQAFGPMHVYFEYWKDTLNIKPKLMVHSIPYGYKIGADILLRKKIRHGKVDPYWYARFNSNTHKHKMKYAERIMYHLNRIDKHINTKLQKKVL